MALNEGNLEHITREETKKIDNLFSLKNCMLGLSSEITLIGTILGSLYGTAYLVDLIIRYVNK